MKKVEKLKKYIKCVYNFLAGHYYLWKYYDKKYTKNNGLTENVVDYVQGGGNGLLIVQKVEKHYEM